MVGKNLTAELDVVKSLHVKSENENILVPPRKRLDGPFVLLILKEFHYRAVEVLQNELTIFGTPFLA
jgi:hypothetical protein